MDLIAGGNAYVAINHFRERKVINDPAKLPTEPFELVKIEFPFEPSRATAEGVTDESLARLGNLKHLTGLHLAASDITDAGLEFLKELKNLTYLEISRSPKVLGKCLAHLNELKRLENFGLTYIPIVDAELVYLKDMKSLTKLRLQGTKITDEGLMHLEGLKNLKVLHLEENSKITDAALPSLTQLKALEHLSLGGTKVTGTGIAKLQNALSNCKITWDGGVVEPQTEGQDVDRQAAEAVLKAGGAESSGTAAQRKSRMPTAMLLPS